MSWPASERVPSVAQRVSRMSSACFPIHPRPRTWTISSASETATSKRHEHALSSRRPENRAVERCARGVARPGGRGRRSEEHTSELQPLMRISYAVFCLKKTLYTYQTRNTSNLQHNT